MRDEVKITGHSVPLGLVHTRTRSQKGMSHVCFLHLVQKALTLFSTAGDNTLLTPSVDCKRSVLMDTRPHGTAIWHSAILKVVHALLYVQSDAICSQGQIYLIAF